MTNNDACATLARVSKFVNTIVAPTHYSASTVREVCKINTTVIHHGIDAEIFNPYIVSQNRARKILKLPLNKKIILWVARINPEKN